MCFYLVRTKGKTEKWSHVPCPTVYTVIQVRESDLEMNLLAKTDLQAHVLEGLQRSWRQKRIHETEMTNSDAFGKVIQRNEEA